MAEARRIFSEGLERFPDSGLLRIKVGWTLAVNAFYVWSDNPKRDMDRAYTLAIEGMKDPHLPRVGEWYGHWLLAWLYLWHDRDFDRAVAEANATLAIAPSHPDSLISLCLVFDFSGQPDTCLRNLDKAMSPSGKAPWWYAHRYYGWAYYLKDECGQAIEHLAKVTKRDINTYRLRAACYARLGKSDLAREAVTEILSISPHESLSGLRKQLPYRKSEDLERLLADLRKAGLPE
jgi:tetratricopeptide (TPR) repeat protein